MKNCLKVLFLFVLFTLLIFSALLNKVSSPHTGKNVENFSLLDHEGNFQELYYYSDKKAIVLIAQGNGCPIVRQSLPYLRTLRDQFESQGVVFLMINSNVQDDRKAIAEEARDFQIDFPILEDKSQVIAESLGITRTAEALVIDPRQWTMVYQGAVHDQWGYESQRSGIRHHYLREAIEALIKGTRVPVSKTPVKGCLISFEATPQDRIYTYSQDVAPILMKSCVPCHSPLGGAPWTMDSYEKVRGWGRMIREVVRTKRMPPWHADPNYGKWQGDFSLGPQELRAVVKWIEQGLTRGEGFDPLMKVAQEQHGERRLGPPDLVFTIKEVQQISASGPDEYRFLDMEQPVEKDLWVRAIELKPRNTNVVHHGNVVVLPPFSGSGSNQSEDPGEAIVKNNLNREEWYRLSGSGMDDGQMISGYSPGSGPFVLPEGTGIFIPRGSQLQLRMHYVPTGKPESDFPQLGLYLYETPPPQVLSIDIISNRSIHIPAGVKEYQREGSYLFEKDVILMGLTPHMHYRGRRMTFAIQYPDGSTETVLSVPNYKFRWQRQYFFEQPLKLAAGTRLQVRGTYDNSAQNSENPDPSREVFYGPGNDAEMFTAVIYFLVPGDGM